MQAPRKDHLTKGVTVKRTISDEVELEWVSHHEYPMSPSIAGYKRN